VKVHGLTEEFLAYKPLFAPIADELMKYLNAAQINIHNAAVDAGFLDEELRRLRRPKSVTHVAEINDSLMRAR